MNHPPAILNPFHCRRHRRCIVDSYYVFFFFIFFFFSCFFFFFLFFVFFFFCVMIPGWEMVHEPSPGYSQSVPLSTTPQVHRRQLLCFFFLYFFLFFLFFFFFSFFRVFFFLCDDPRLGDGPCTIPRLFSIRSTVDDAPGASSTAIMF